MILVSCFALLLVLSKASFAQDFDDVDDPAPACSCCYCMAMGAPAPMPFAYPPCPAAPRHFGSRLAALVGRHTLPFGTPYPGMPMSPALAPYPAYPATPVGPVAAPYPYGVTDLKYRAVRRAARLAPPPQPYPVPVPMAVAPPQVLPAPAPEGYAPGAAPVVQTGRRNLQRYGDAPVINFMSIVRTQQPYPYYPYPMPVQPQFPMPVRP